MSALRYYIKCKPTPNTFVGANVLQKNILKLRYLKFVGIMNCGNYKKKINYLRFKLNQK